MLPRKVGLAKYWTVQLAIAVAAQLTFAEERSEFCPYESIARPCDIKQDGLVGRDCVLGSPGQHTKLHVAKLYVPQGVKLLVHRGEGVEVEVLASGIKIDGEFWAGCPGQAAAAFNGKLVLALEGAFRDFGNASRWVGFNWHSAGLPSMGWGTISEMFPKGLLVTQTGRLELHGKLKTSWQYLAVTAARGDNSLTLDADLSWEPGDELVVGSTTSDASQSEIVKIASVHGRTVVLDSALQFEHAGVYEGHGSSLNAPVGLRSRNIKVLGRMADGTDAQERAAWRACKTEIARFPAGDPHQVRQKCFGGHSIYFQHSVVHIEHVEFTSMGQAMIMARYPVHWHLAGNASGHYLRNSSLHNNFQRCVTVHGTADALLSNNVCHETFGHAFYLEDGIESGNTFQRNLVITANPGGSVCTDFERGSGARSNTQLGPSGFWITNPDNNFFENHVVGVGTGYWFTFPMASLAKCALAPGSVSSCSKDPRHGAGGVFGPSKRYFADNRSGYGPQHWWTNQEQARTRVRSFTRNVVSGSHRGIFIDGRVYDSGDGFISHDMPGGSIPCLGDGCPTCSGPLEGSFTWAPMLFDKTLSPNERTYAPTVNVFEDFYAAHIVGYTQLDESRGLWASGGVILFTGAVFLNVYVVAAASEDLTGGCWRPTTESPPGFPIVFQDSLFISGPLSSTFFEIYDAGILVARSRWLVPPDTGEHFYVAKPKTAFGGNGNPVYFRESGQLGRFAKDSESKYFAWASALASGEVKSDRSIPRLASFESLAWASPYTKGSYVYSTDMFGLDKREPVIIAADAMSHGTNWGRQSRIIQGLEACAEYLKGTPPRFFCGAPFGSYGLWCGDGIRLCDCPGAVADARHWYKDLHPWVSLNRSAHAVGHSACQPRPVAEDLTPWELQGSCAFPAPPPTSTPYTWDKDCRSGGLGCNADGRHMECRWCGFAPFAACPSMTSTTSTSSVGPSISTVAPATATSFGSIGSGAAGEAEESEELAGEGAAEALIACGVVLACCAVFLTTSYWCGVHKSPDAARALLTCWRLSGWRAPSSRSKVRPVVPSVSSSPPRQEGPVLLGNFVAEGREQGLRPAPVHDTKGTHPPV